MYKCKICDKQYKTRQSLGGHVSSHYRGDNYKLSRETEKSKIRKAESKIKVKFCKFCNKEFSNGLKLGGHLIQCSKNPDGGKNLANIKEGQKKRRGIKLDKETKDKISESMKVAHKEDRAWNIGMSRWNNEPSYPESFFMKVIENHFKDKEYKYECPMDRYSLDFAWIHKKKYIEIDGAQHERFEEYVARDKKKDKIAKSLGWEVLRIKWKDMYNDPHTYIEKAVNFIN